jgi:DNA-binding response OmpR family regulator
MRKHLSRVLIIQDENATTDFLKPILEQEMFEVILAHNGQTGIAFASEQDLSAVILDIMMPDGDLWEICRQVRNSNNAPIIMLSAMNKPGLVAKALDAGADEFLVKPVPTSILLTHLKRLTRRAQAEKDASAKKLTKMKTEGQGKMQ